MIVVTGGAGFIGSNLIKGLNLRGLRDILVIDDLTQGKKCANLSGLDIADYMDKNEFLQCLLTKKHPFKIDALFHQGACTDTTEWDGRYLMEVNYTYSKHLLHECLERNTPFIYASSASVYGRGACFIEAREHEHPLNMYAFSKFQFDQYVRSIATPKSQVVGLRYFNVYGPGEAHKEKMASVIFQLNAQLGQGETIQLFGGCDGYGDGEQLRDFVYVDDVVAVNLWLFDNPSISGIYNLGTGCAQTFNTIAKTIISFHGRGKIEYIPFPAPLMNAYQSYTQADMTRLRMQGYAGSFTPIDRGIPNYLHWLKTVGITSSHEE